MWPEWVGMAGQRMGRWSIGPRDIFSIDRHTYHTDSESRRWDIDRSDCVVASDLFAQFTGRAKKRQYCIAQVWRTSDSYVRLSDFRYDSPRPCRQDKRNQFWLRVDSRIWRYS